MSAQTDHRTKAEIALAQAQRNPVMSAEQSFLSAQVHALLAVEHRLEEVVAALRDARSRPTPVNTRTVDERTNGGSHLRAGTTVKSRDGMQDQLDRAADDGWPAHRTDQVRSGSAR